MQWFRCMVGDFEPDPLPHASRAFVGIQGPPCDRRSYRRPPRASLPKKPVFQLSPGFGRLRVYAQQPLWERERSPDSQVSSSVPTPTQRLPLCHGKERSALLIRCVQILKLPAEAPGGAPSAPPPPPPLFLLKRQVGLRGKLRITL